MELDTNMKMNLYEYSKSTLVGLFIVFGCVFGITVIIGAAGPHILDSYHTSALAQGVDMRSNTSAFNWEIQHLDKLNQMLFLQVAVVNGRAAVQGVSTNLAISASLYGSKDGFAFTPLVVRKTEWRKIKCSQGNMHCNEVTLLHEPFLEYPIYRTDIRFLNAQAEDWIQDAAFIWRVFNHSYTLFELWFRFVFLVVGFVFLVWFSYRLKSFRFADWSVEQKWMVVLLFGLLGFNNPFFPLTILVDSAFAAFLDVSLFVTFLAALLVFWLCVFDSIRKPAGSRSFLGFYLPKIGLVSILWLSSLVVFLWQELHDLDDPTYDNANDIPGFIFFRVVQILIMIIYVFWLIYVVILGVKDRRAFPMLNVRLKFLGVLTFVVIAITVAGIVLGVLGTVQNNAAQFLSFFSLFNLYIYALSIVYAPSKGAAGPAHARLGNMVALVDSDEASDAAGAGAGAGASHTRFRDSFTDEQSYERSAGHDSGSDLVAAGPDPASDLSAGDDSYDNVAELQEQPAPAPKPAPVFGAQPLKPVTPVASTPQPNLL